VRETKVSAAGTRTTWSLHPDKSGGLAFEQEFAENGTVTNRNFLTAGGAVIGVLITQGDTWVNNAQVNRTTVVRTEYLHKDHLGSTAAVTDGAGAVTARYAFDPWGKRRFTNGTYDAFGTLVIEFSAGNTDRGFTGHEHLDDVGIVHMNGRLYDAHTGRFLQPDPYVQEVLLLQNFNRYSYVLNNPLNATDPSGEFIPQLLFAAAAFIVAKHVPELRPFMAIAVSIVIGPVGPWSVFGNNIASAAFAGFSAGAVGSGSFKGGIQGMFSGAVFYGIGDSFGRVSWANPGEMAKAVAAHAAAGCAMQAVSGGNCRAGALSGAFSKATAPLIQKDIVVGTVVSAIVGGTGSELGKGKFANGAVTGSFSYLFNEITTAVEHFKGLSDDPELGSPRWSMGRLNGTTPLPETEISGLRFAAATSEALLLWNPSRWLATGAQILGWGAAVEQAFDPQDPSFGGIAGALASYATELSSSSIRSSVVVGYAAEKSWEFLAPRWAEDMRQSRVTPAQVSLSCARPHAYRQ
jgi:RHS repeat-associated protein